MALLNIHPTQYRTLSSLLDNDFFASTQQKSTPKSTYPAVNIQDTNDSFILELIAPGLKKEDFNLSIKDNTLKVSAIKKETEANKNHYTKKEFTPGSFERSFSLPEGKIDESTIQATYENGILLLDLPKQEKETPLKRVININ